MQIGNFAASVTAMKSLPSTYNLDFQEITPRLWESIENACASLDMFHKLLPKLKVTKDFSFKTNASFVAATELANVLVRKHKVPFRTAHKIVGALVKSLIDAKLTFKNATPEMLQKQAKEVANIELAISPYELKELTDPLKLVEACKVLGGPAPRDVRRALSERKKKLILTRMDILKMDEALEKARGEMEAVIQKHLHMGQ
jgi:argininosuccinate lyase